MTIQSASNDDIVRAFLADNKTIHTVRTYIPVIDEFLTYMKNRPLSEISNKDATEYLEYLYLKRHMVKSTLFKVKRTLLSLYNFAFKRNYLEYNPFFFAKMPDVKLEKQDFGYVDRSRILTRQELKQLLKEAKKSIRNYAIIKLLYTSRFSTLELTNFSWGNIFSINQNLWGAEVKTKGKNKSRIIPLRKDVVDLLMSYREILGFSGDPKSIDRIKENGMRVFLNRYGKPISDTGIRKTIYKLCSDAGIKTIAPKDIAHLCIPLANLGGLKDKGKLAEQANFSTEKLVDKYNYIYDILKDAACNFVTLEE
ncbi:MAG: tyrosine-type recombinase/integrase [Clostridia bacterium]|nr:tyrosine-type recombinase/integrase [Clostridia bacterium]